MTQTPLKDTAITVAGTGICITVCPGTDTVAITVYGSTERRIPFDDLDIFISGLELALGSDFCPGDHPGDELIRVVACLKSLRGYTTP
jgi:hypothetical protein